MHGSNGWKGLFIIFLLVALAGAANAASVSQLGYHPSSAKQVVEYTAAGEGTFAIRQSGTGTVVFSGILQKARDYNGNPVNCQGGQACLVGDFTNFTQPGTYYITTSSGDSTMPFTISNAIFQQATPTFLEFFNAQLQQGSSYHADMHAGYTPQLNTIADGSFIMTADQAATTLIRLGNAYRRNPAIFTEDQYVISAPGKPDMQEYIRGYVAYLKGLQGIQVQERSDGAGFRLNPSMEIQNAFVPGPTDRTSLDVYIPGGTLLATVPVRSLCGADDGSARWDQCMADAALYYKCQADEPCLNLTYIDRTGVVAGYSGYDVATGWEYEFGCYIDVNVNQPAFNGQYNGCLIFNADASRENTVKALLAYLEALPAINDYSPAEAQDLYNRAVATYAHVKSSNPVFDSNDADAGYWGAALFLLYGYSGDAQYLHEAHAVRGAVGTTLDAAGTRGNELYWEEYVRHKGAITAAGLQYANDGVNPEEYFRGKIYNDWKDRGNTLSIARNGERVYQYDMNIQFQNSRYMLTEALFSAKAAELHASPESFIPRVADYQLAWLTGMNRVQQGVALGSPLGSQSFIFGIGNSPDQFHSRYLVNTGYRSASGGKVVGARGTGYQFHDGTGYVYLDGVSTILGHTYGAFGNGWRGEPKVQPFMVGQTFSNGKTIIPGWINGAFDTVSDGDLIYNYHDTVNTYEFTESTNEMVATAMELLAYMDGRMNGRPPYGPLHFNYTGPPANTTMPVCGNSVVESGETCDDGNTANGDGCSSTCQTEAAGGCFTSLQSVPATCTGTITSDTYDGCRHIACTSGSGSVQVLACDKPGAHNAQHFEMYRQSASGVPPKVCLHGTCLQHEGFARSANYPLCGANTTVAVCGNSVVESGETCDDGNTAGGDGCSSTCQAEATGGACHNSVDDIPVTCTGGSITQDTFNGCRAIVCSASGSSMKVLACNKPGNHDAQYFEMYKQAQTGSGISKICLSDVCIGANGFVRSGNYPLCDANTTVAVCGNSVVESGETCDDGNTAGGDGCSSTCQLEVTGTMAVDLHVKEWFPKGRDYVFVCAASGFAPTSYDWVFGDGHQQIGSSNREVFHRYEAAGNYTVSCAASDGAVRKTDAYMATVS